jgi:outer membrane receptor protein involved in Fe transport
VKNGFAGALRARYLQDRPANEDNSVIAEGYTIIDLNGSYSFNAFTVGFFIQNLLNSDWKEAQFDTESRIRLASGNLEPSPVSEIHFTPGTPFNFTGFIKFTF